MENFSINLNFNRMKRTYFSALLMGTLTLASVSVFTSCKDYDDDINAVESTADANNALIKKLQEQATTLTTAASNAQSTADAAKTAAAEAAAAAKKAQDAADAAKAAGDTNAAAVAKAQAAAETATANAEAAKAAAAEAQKAAIEDAAKQVDALKTEMEAALKAGLDSKLDAATFDNKVAEINDKFVELEGVIAGINSTLNTLGDNVKKNTADIKTNADAIATLTAANQDAKVQIAALEAYKKTLEENTIPGLQAAIDANGVAIGDVKKSLDDLKGDIATAQDALTGQIAEITGNLATLKATVEGIDKAYKEADADLQKQITDLLKEVKDNKTAAATALEGAVSTINAKLDATNKLVEDNKTELKKYTDDQLAAVKKDLQEQIDNLAKLNVGGIEKGLATWIDEINKKCDTYYTKAEFTTFKQAYDQKIAEIEKDIKKINDTSLAGLTTNINTLHVLLSQRLASLVFAPTTYIDGIEAIKFASLQYMDWGNNPADWERDAAKPTGALTVIRDINTTVKYLMNPTGVSLNDIESFEFVANNATNETRAAVQSPIAVVGKSIDKNGYLVLNVQKTGTTSFGAGSDAFQIVALKAKLAKSVLAESEVKENKEVYVFSDWARLYETSNIPFIHNKKAHDAQGKVDDTQPESHFWNYSTMYDGGTKADELRDYNNDKYLAATVPYNQSIDLLSLVEVCDKVGTVYSNLDSYNLKFEFHLLDYKLKNELQTVDATNQIKFGKLLEDGHTLVSTARDNTSTNNRDAIGRQPVVQAVLKDMSDPDKPKVVDVRYFKIKWAAVQTSKDYGELATLDKDMDNHDSYICGEQSEYLVNEEKVNAVYTEFDYSRDMFHAQFYPVAQMFGTIDDAKTGNNPLAGVSFTDMSDWWSAGQTHNFKLSIDWSKFKATQAEYEAGKLERTFYGYFKNTVDQYDRITFSVKVTAKINKMGFAQGINYSVEQWTPTNVAIGTPNKDKYRTINPSLRSDNNYGTSAGKTDAQLVGDLKAGYIHNGQVPQTVDALLKEVGNTQNKQLVFDKSRLAEVATATGTTAASWSLSNDEKSLKYNNVTAATIDASGIIRLHEAGTPGVNGAPTAGALKLVGHKVPVVLKSSYCSLVENNIDQYLVNFIKPLSISANAITDKLTDIRDGGSSSISIAGKIVVKEIFGNERTILGPANQLDREAAALRNWYIVETPFWDEANIKTNLTANGGISANCDTKLSSLKNADGTVKYRVAIDQVNNKVAFHNMSGNAISQDFKISIPVVVKTKWETKTLYVEITVQKGF